MKGIVRGTRGKPEKGGVIEAKGKGIFKMEGVVISVGGH